MGPRFRLEAFVARGAWGAVYRGVDLETGAAVAVKRLHDHLCEPTMLERFEREARMLSSLHNPHVVRYVAHGRDEQDRPYLALEWLDGEDLARWRKAPGRTLRQVVELVRQAALGLAALHDAGIVHRDIKPSNFFLTTELGGPRVVLIDLGIARTYADPALTAVGFLLGTPAYMSPEQARGQQRLTARSDLFSLGVMLFELCAGQKPYRADDMASMAMKIALQSPPHLREVLPSASADLDALVARAMSRAPEDRFPSGRELSDALGRLPLSEDVAPSSSRDVVISTTGDTTHRQLFVSDSASSAGRALSLSAVREQRVVTVLFARADGAGDRDAALGSLQALGRRNGGVSHEILGPRRVVVFGGGGLPGDEAARAARTALTAATIDGLRLALVTGQLVADDGSLSGGVLTRGLRELDRSHDAIHLDESTARLLEGRFAIQGGRGERTLQPQSAEPGAFGATLLGQAMPFLGRDRELGALVAVHEQCVSEPVARAVLLIGPAGSGKSRLRDELLRRLAASATPSVLLVGRGDPIGQASPFGMLAGAIRGLAGLLNGEPLDEQRRKLTARFAETLREPALGRACAFLGELCRVPFPADRAPGLGEARHTPMLMHDAMRAAFAEWIAAECARGPVLLTFDDLHWGDLPSVKFTDALLSELRDRPLFVLGSGRPEVYAQFPGIWAGRDLEEMRLGALTRKAAEKLVRHALGPAVTAATVELAVDRAAGNVFYLEELIRALAEGRGDELPETVLGMVQARLDALGAPAKRLLRAASVFGQRFWVGGVEALLGDAGGPGVTAMLDQLVEGEIVGRVRAASLPGQTEYAFLHALVRDAAHAMLPAEDRATGHRLAGEWLMAHGFSDAAVLAEHFARAGEGEQASAWYGRAATLALEGNDLAAAVSHADRGVATTSNAEAQGKLRLIQAEALRFRGELAAAEAKASEAWSALRPGSTPWLRVAAELAASAGLLGHVDRLDEVGRALAQLPADPARRDAQVVSLCRTAIPLFWAGQVGAAPLFARIDALATPVTTLDSQARALTHFSRATRALYGGRPGDHLVEQRAAHQAFLDGADRRNACGRQVALGFAYGELGLYAEGEQALREALAESERLGLHNLSVRARNNLGNVLCRRGSLADARVVEEQAVAACVAQGDPRLEAGSRNYLARILQLSGDGEGAEREAKKAADLSTSAPAMRAYALGALSRVLLQGGRVREALESALAASEIVGSLGHLDEGESSIRLAFAEALFAAGDAVRGLRALRIALDRLSTRAATIADPVARASFLGAIAENEATRSLARAHGLDPDDADHPSGA